MDLKDKIVKIFGVDEVSGANQVIWKHTNGDFYFWGLDENGKRTSQKPIKQNEIYSYEKSFDQDFNSSFSREADVWLRF